MKEGKEVTNRTAIAILATTAGIAGCFQEGDEPEVSLGNGIAAVDGARHEKDFSLDVGSEVEEIHYLRYARA